MAPAGEVERKPLMTGTALLMMNLGFFGVQFSFGLTQSAVNPLFLLIFIGTALVSLALAVLAFAVLGGVILLLTTLNFGKGAESERVLKITIPENLDYDGLFDDIFSKYARSCNLVKVKTSNMGTLYELEYHIVLRDASLPKAFLDEIRCRNGNLNVVCGKEVTHEAL